MCGVAPRKFVEGKAESSGEGADFRCSGAVDVELPIERLEGIEIAATIFEGNPRKAVTAAKSVGVTAADRAFAILDADLRGEAEHISASGGELDEGGEDVGHEKAANEGGENTAAGDAGEGAVGGGNEGASEGEALRLIAIEDFGSGAARNDRGEFPRQINGVTDAGVHALTAGGAVDMAGVAADKGVVDAEVVGDAMVDFIGREPIHLVDANVGHVFGDAANVLEGDFFGFLGSVGNDADEAVLAGGANGKDDQEKIGTKAEIDVVVNGAGEEMNVGHVKEAFVSAAGEAKIEGLTDGAMGTVAAANVLDIEIFGSAWTFELGMDAGFILSEVSQLGIPFDLNAHASE